MSDRIPAAPGEDGSTPVPRDPPDQQATDEPDAWDLDVGKVAADDSDSDGGSGGDDSDSGKSAEVPDTDEGGTARRGESRPLESHPEKPVPDEPSG
ncbi:hypothetical protein ACWGH2_43110 [Streptomyces sp. NPDC054871]